MIEETNQVTVMPPTATKINIGGRKQLCITIGVISSIIIIAVVVIPTSIVLTRKTDTTIIPITTFMIPTTTAKLILTTSESVRTTTITVITTDTTAITTSTPTTTETMTTTPTPILVTNPTGRQIFKRTTEKLYAIWNTTAGGDSTPSSAGDGTGTYRDSQPPEAAIDGSVTTDYTNHGICNSESVNSIECGLNTGFYLTLAVKRFTLEIFRLATNREAISRDPLMITIEGSNYNQSELTFGKSWTLIYNGTTGLTNDPRRSTFGMPLAPSTPLMPFTSYRLLVTSKRSESNAVSYSELQMLGLIEYV